MDRDWPELETKSVRGLIRTMRGRRVILDSDLAMLFGTQTKRLNQQVRRNADRFADFVFELTEEEHAQLRSQDVTAKRSRGGRTSPPLAFDEYGVAMASTVLTSPRAVAALRLVIRVFVDSRQQMLSGAAEAEMQRRDAPLREQVAALKVKVLRMGEAIADYEINRRDKTSVRDEVEKLSTSLIDNMKAQLEAKAIANESVMADIQVKLAQAEKLQAEARKTESEAEKIDIDNARQRFDLLLAMVEKVDALDTLPFTRAMSLLGGPAGDADG